MRIGILIIVWMLCTYAVLAQEVPRILNFSQNDYQAQRQNWSITQSPDLEMFFGNGSGLLAYDGSWWRILHLPNQQIARAVARDAEGRIFTGGFAEFGFWQRDATGNYRYHSLSTALDFPKVKKEEIWHIVVHAGKVYFQSFSSIYKYDYKTVRYLKPPSNIMFLHAIDKRLIVQGLRKGLFELTQQDSFVFIKNSEILAKTTVSTILPHKGTFLIGTTKDGIFKYENDAFSVWNPTFNALAKDFQVNKGIQLANGNYAFGTILNGVFILNTEGGIQYHINQENGLQNNTILSMFEDNAHNLWLGLDKGIDLIDLTTPLTFFHDKSGKIGSVYTAVLHNKCLYVGTNQGVFYRNEGENQFRLLKGLQGQVWDLQVFDNQLLCGHNSGTFLIKKDKTLEKISEETGGWMLIRHPQKPNILIQGLYTGMALYQKNAAGQWFFYKKINGFGETTKRIAFDEYGNLWAITPNNQLFKIKLSENLENTEGVTQILSPVLHKPFMSKVDNTLLFSSAQGHYVYNSQTQKLDNFNHPLLLGEKGKIMQSIGQDVIKIMSDKLEIFTSKNPITTAKKEAISPDFSLKVKLMPDYETIIILDSTRYLLGLDDGYALFDKRFKISPSPKNAQAIMRLFAKDGVSFHFYPSDSSKKDILLPPQYRELKIAFALPFFTQSPKFKYLLSNHLEEWSDWENSSSRDLVNLAKGEHQFSLQNDVSKIEKNMTFAIKPYWYETFLAQILYVLALFLGIFWLQKYHKHQLDKQREKLEAEKRRELEQQRIKIENEKLQTEVKEKSKELANSTMNLIQKNEVLLEIKTELDTMKTGLPEKHYHRLSHLIDFNLTHEEQARVFEENFNDVHEDFLKRLKVQYPTLTPSDLKLAAFLRMNLSSKEISPLLFISVRTIENKRYLLRKKLELSESYNLTSFLIEF